MKKCIPLILLIVSVFTFCVSCDTRYSYAAMTIKNASSANMIYKGLVRDETSGDESGDWIVKTILPNTSRLSASSSDTISHTWKDGYDSIKFALCWGFDNTADYSVYDNTMDYITVYDGENVILTVNGSETPTVTRSKL